MSMGGKEDGGAGKAAAAAGKRADAAAKKMTGYGDEAVSFTKKFYQDYVVPQLKVIQTEQAKGIARADEVYGQQQAQFTDREGTYQQYGKPAVGKYFDMVDQFDPEAEAQRRGLSVMGDIASQQQNAQQQTARGLRARGVNPTSGDAIKALGRTDMQASLIKAQEMNRLRNLTQAQGMQLKTDAAKFGAGLGGEAAGMSGRALQAGVIGSDVANAAAGSITRGTGIPMSGLELAGGLQSNIYSAEKGAQTNLQNTSAQLKSQDGGIGGLLGGIAGAFLGGPGGAVVGKSLFG